MAALPLGLPAQARSQATIWSATLTVGQPAPGSGNAFGYCRGAANCSTEALQYGSLSESAFSIGETDYEVASIRWGFGGENRTTVQHVHLTLDRRPAPGDEAVLVLHLGGTALRLADASVNEPSDHGFSANYTWDDGDNPPALDSVVDARLTGNPPPLR